MKRTNERSLSPTLWGQKQNQADRKREGEGPWEQTTTTSADTYLYDMYVRTHTQLRQTICITKLSAALLPPVPSLQSLSLTAPPLCTTVCTCTCTETKARGKDHKKVSRRRFFPFLPSLSLSVPGIIQFSGPCPVYCKPSWALSLGLSFSNAIVPMALLLLLFFLRYIRGPPFSKLLPREREARRRHHHFHIL